MTLIFYLVENLMILRMGKMIYTLKDWLHGYVLVTYTVCQNCYYYDIQIVAIPSLVFQSSVFLNNKFSGNFLPASLLEWNQEGKGL